MLLDFLNDMKSITVQNNLLSSFVEKLEDLKDSINDKLVDNNLLKKEKNDELYYVYAYNFPKVYITKQKSNKVELLEGVSDEFKKNLAEGFILRYKDGKFLVDEELTEKSMNFEFDFDNYKE